jgi:type IV pilus assembly protein PilE
MKTQRRLEMQRRRGFTLIELMIIVVIIAIVAAVAYPSYTDAVRKSRRAEGKSALLKAAQLQERLYTGSGTYTVDLAPLFGRGANQPVYSGEDPATGYYTITAVASGALTQGYTLIATPGGAPAGGAQGNFVDPVCANLTLSSTGQRGFTGTGPGADTSACW